MKKILLNLPCIIICALILITGCSSNKPLFMEIQYCTEAFHLPAKRLYPALDLSKINRLPVYEYLDKDSLYERTSDFAAKLLIDTSQMTDESEENSKEVRYINDDKNIHCNLYASENLVSLYAETNYNFDSDIVNTQIGSYPFMLDYEVNESGFVLSEDAVQLYKDNARELLKKLHKENYTQSDFDISIHPYIEDTDYLKNNDYTVTIILSYYPPKSGENCSDEVLELYSLDSHISLDITYFSKNGFQSVWLKEYNSDWLNEVGQYEIIPHSEVQLRFDNDDNVRYGNYDYAHDPVTDIPNETWKYYTDSDTVRDYGTYLVYVEDKEGYIRPLYMKQDYRRVGQMEGAAWIDAIEY